MALTFRSAPRISQAQFARVLQRYRSPCAPIAAECYDIICSYGLDPAVALAFFGHESVFGTRGVAVQTLNWGNVRTPFKVERAVGTHPRNFAIFRSWQDGLRDWCERINERYINQRGLDTVEKAIPVYAPSSDGNNEARYIEHVHQLVAAWIAEDRQTSAPDAAALRDALLDLPPDRTEDDPDVLLERVMPMLKPLALLNTVREQRLPMLVYRPLVGELMLTYVIDEERSVTFINEDHLRAWGVDEPTLYRRAIYNLRAKPWTPRPGLIGAGPGALLIFNGRDGYDATRVILPELFQRFAAAIPGNLVIGVPNRDFLIAFGDADAQVFAQIRAQIEVDAATQQHPISAQLLTYRDGALAVYDPRAAPGA